MKTEDEDYSDLLRVEECSHLFQTGDVMWCLGGHCRYSPRDGVAGCLPELHSCWQQAAAVGSLPLWPAHTGVWCMLCLSNALLEFSCRICVDTQKRAEKIPLSSSVQWIPSLVDCSPMSCFSISLGGWYLPQTSAAAFVCSLQHQHRWGAALEAELHVHINSPAVIPMLSEGQTIMLARINAQKMFLWGKKRSL